MLSRSLRTAAMLSVLLAGCGGGGGGKDAAPPAGELTGLYEGGGGARRNQLCVIDEEGRNPRFGLIVWGSGDTSCGGTGTMRRDGDRLRLLLDNDEACVIEARIAGERVSVSGALSGDCARYYCGGDARLDGAAFDRVGGSRDDAGRAVDLVGDRLCAG